MATSYRPPAEGVVGPLHAQLVAQADVAAGPRSRRRWCAGSRRRRRRASCRARRARSPPRSGRPCRICWPATQMFPQAPQLFGSEVVSLHVGTPPPGGMQRLRSGPADARAADARLVGGALDASTRCSSGGRRSCQRRRSRRRPTPARGRCRTLPGRGSCARRPCRSRCSSSGPFSDPRRCWWGCRAPGNWWSRPGSGRRPASTCRCCTSWCTRRSGTGPTAGRSRCRRTAAPARRTAARTCPGSRARWSSGCRIPRSCPGRRRCWSRCPRRPTCRRRDRSSRRPPRRPARRRTRRRGRVVSCARVIARPPPGGLPGATDVAAPVRTPLCPRACRSGDSRTR